LRILNFLEKFRILSIKLDKHEIIEFKKRSLIILFLGTFGGVSMLCFNIYFNFNRRIFVARVKSSSGHLGEFCGHYDKNLNHVIVLSILESLLLENDLGKYSRIEYKNMIEGAKYVCLENLDSSRSFVINKAGGFFHFYLEVMPILLRNRDKNFSIHFIIEDKPFYQSILNFYQLKYVNTAVDNFDSIETLESSKYYPSFEEIKWFRNFNSIFAKDKSVSKRIYISRKNESARRISNEIEILGELSKLDFVLIDPGQLSFEEQVKYFTNAEIIVSPHGAAMSNIIWCSNSVEVIELNGDKDVRWHFAKIAKALNFNYTLLLGRTIDEMYFEVNIESLKVIVERFNVH